MEKKKQIMTFCVKFFHKFREGYFIVYGWTPMIHIMYVLKLHVWWRADLYGVKSSVQFIWYDVELMMCPISRDIIIMFSLQRYRLYYLYYQYLLTNYDYHLILKYLYLLFLYTYIKFAYLSTIIPFVFHCILMFCLYQ